MCVSRSELEACYADSDYEVRLPGGRTLVLRANQRHPELDAYLEQHHPEARSWLFITAWNPHSRPLDDAANQRRQDALRVELEQRGFPWYPGEGRAREGAPPWAEASFFVVGPSLEESLELGRSHEQNAVLVGELGEPAQILMCS